MNWLSLIAIALTAYVSIFLEALPGTGLRSFLGVQLDVLPSLMAYTAMAQGPFPVAALSVLAGLGFDSVSANPLGITVLPLLSIGLLVHLGRDFILADQVFAQIGVGAMASALAPVLTVISLLGAGDQPLAGWGSLWQWLVMAVAGGLLTPIWFKLFGRIGTLFSYPVLAETSFQPDHEMKRGRF